MAAETVLGLALGELLKAVETLIGSIQEYDPILKKLQITLKQMTPIVQKIHNLCQELDHREDGKTTQELKRIIAEGHKLVGKCKSEMNGCCSCFKKPGCAEDLQDIYNSIKDFCDIFVQLEIHRNVIEINHGVRKIQEDVGTLLKQKTPPKEGEGGRGLDIGAPQMQGRTPSDESGGSKEPPQLGSKGYNGSVNNLPLPSNGRKEKITSTTKNGPSVSNSIPPPTVPHESPKVARETYSKVKGLPDVAKDESRQPVHAKLPDDTEAGKRLSNKDTSSAVSSTMVHASTEHHLSPKRPGNSLKGPDASTGRGGFNQVQETNSPLHLEINIYYPAAIPPKHQELEAKHSVNPDDRFWHRDLNELPKKPSVQESSESSSLRLPTPKRKEIEEEANHLPYSGMAGHLVASEQIGTGATNSVISTHPYLPFSSPQVKTINDEGKYSYRPKGQNHRCFK